MECLKLAANGMKCLSCVPVKEEEDGLIHTGTVCSTPTQILQVILSRSVVSHSIGHEEQMKANYKSTTYAMQFYNH